jgi:hypothetical protein
MAFVQNPVVLLEYGKQQPVSGQSAFVAQVGRQPIQSGFSPWLQEPRQQSFAIVALPGLQVVSPVFLQGLSQAAFWAQILVPVS